MSFKIFPATITNDGRKVPLVKDWANQASADPNVHRQWQEFYGDKIKLWGMPCGFTNGIYALDIDVKDGVNGFDSLRSLGVNELPYTSYQQTPSGGMHLFFKYDQHYNFNTVNKDLKLDTRSDDGFCWVYQPRFDIPLAPIPQWIDSILKKKPKETKVTDLSTANVVQLDPGIALDTFNNSINAVLNAGQGERNHTLNTHAYVVGKLVASGALSAEYAYEKLKEAALKIGLPDREAHTTIMSGLGSGTENPIVSPFGNGPVTPNIFIPEVPVVVERPRWTPSMLTFNMLQDWTKLKMPQLFEDWSPQDIILTSAVGGVGKTTLKLYEAVCLALGEDFIGFRNIKPGRTLFIIGEDSEAKLAAILGRMCKQLGLFEPGNEHKVKAVLENVVIKRSTDLCLVAQDPKTRSFVPNYEALEKIKEAIDDLNPISIVFDPIAMFWGNESGGNDMGMALMKAMIEIQSYSKAQVEIISHIGKDSHSRKDMSQFSGRGGTAIPNHARVVRTLLKLNAKEFKEETGRDLEEGRTAVLVYVSKFSDGSPILDKPFVLVRNGYVFEKINCIEKISDNPNQKDNVGKEKETVYSYVKAVSTEERPLTLPKLADIMVIHGITKSKTKAVVTILILEGLIEEAVHPDATVGKWLKVK